MTDKTERHKTVLALHPRTRGIGYAVLEGPRRLVDRGVIGHRFSIEKLLRNAVTKLVEQYQPDIIVHETIDNTKKTNRAGRLLTLLDSHMTERKIEISTYTREDILNFLDMHGKTDSHGIARKISIWFPSLEASIPRKRKFFETQNSAYHMFIAIAFALTHYYLDD